MSDAASVSEFRDAIYTENEDKFIVCAQMVPNPDGEEYNIFVKRVLRNDPRHGIQYKAGDSFHVFHRTKDNPYSRFWHLNFMGWDQIPEQADAPKTQGRGQ